MREISKSPRITGKVLLQNLIFKGIEISSSTQQRTLKKEGLKRSRPRKIPLLIARHVKARLYFARKYIDKETSFWSLVLWPDKTKIELYGHRDVSFVRREIGEAFKPKNTIPAMKHCGGSLMFWGCFSANETGRLVRVEGIMKKDQNVKILRENFEKCAEALDMGPSMMFQHNNNPKYTVKYVKNG